MFLPLQKKPRATIAEEAPVVDETEQGGDSTAVIVENTLPTCSIYFESTEAKNLFGVEFNDDDDVIKKIENRIDLLYTANKTSYGWRNVVCGHDPHNTCTQHDIFVLQKKAQYVGLALHFAQSNMPTTAWLVCCQHAINKLAEVGCHFISNPKTVQVWHHAFKSNECFPHPHPAVANGQEPLPPFFEENPKIKAAFIAYANSNLPELSCEFMLHYVHDTLIQLKNKGVPESVYKGKK